MKLFKKKYDGYTLKIKFLFGVIYYKKNILSLEKELRICGLKIYQQKISDSLIYNALYKFLKHKKHIKKNIINLAGSPSGELYIVLNLINYLFKNTKNEDILFVVDKPFKYNLCKFFKPDIECLLIKNMYLYLRMKGSYNFKDCTIYSFFTTEHYLKQDVLINNANEHYYNYILKEFNLENEKNIQFQLPETSIETKERIAAYIKKNKLEKFIIICPEANTCAKFPDDFWKTLCKDFQAQGYKIFLNIMKTENYVEDCYINYFNYEEMIELAKYSKGVVGLRSGLIEILSTIGIPITALYQPFPKRGLLQPMKSDKALSGFTLKKLPNVHENNILEVIYKNNEDIREIEEFILKEERLCI